MGVNIADLSNNPFIYKVYRIPIKTVDLPVPAEPYIHDILFLNNDLIASF